MKLNLKSLLLILISIFCSITVANSDVIPNGLFSDNAVIQQGMRVPVWGTAAEGERVTVRFQHQTISTKASNRNWMIYLKPLKSGGPFTLEISGSNTITIKNVMVGEVWVCAGQSNMELPLFVSENADSFIKTSEDSLLRFAIVPDSEYAPTNFNVTWQESNPSTSYYFSAVGYHFGKALRKSLGVPIGLIRAAKGGSYAEAWISRTALESDLTLSHLIKDVRSSYLYEGMIKPLQPYAIRGVIWYQGESNVDRAFEYRNLFPALIRDWRQAWGQKKLPFLFVQLAPYHTKQTEPSDSLWAELRESQLLTSKSVPDTAMTVITDAGDQIDIHPRKKEIVGNRLASAAKAIVYKKPVCYMGPMFESIQIKNGSAVISFDNSNKGLTYTGSELSGFTISGSDGKFVNAKAILSGLNKVKVWSDRISNPIAVRYGWADYPIGNLYNKAEFPASPFRTDDFGLLSKNK